jgi:ABC-type glycerol-3-phosphate transport system substrate-binding protein
MLDSEMAAENGIDTEKLKDNVMDMLDTLLEIGDPWWCAGAYMGIANTYFCHDVFPDLIDYSSETVFLSATDVAAYMRKVQMLHSFAGQLPADASNSFFDNSMLAYIGSGRNWYTSGFPIHVTTLNLAFEYAAIAKSENSSLEMFPLRAYDGSVNANVTYWGAVGAGSEHADLAYDFLRLFLQEEVQWEGIRKDANRLINTPDWKLNRTDIYISWGLVTNGWPVRSVDSVEHIWQAYNKNINTYDDSGNEDKSWRERIQKLKDIAMENMDFQILNIEIDEVRFSNKYEKDLSKDLASLNNGANGFAPNTVDIDKLAMDAVLNLESLLYEGY